MGEVGRRILLYRASLNLLRGIFTVAPASSFVSPLLSIVVGFLIYIHGPFDSAQDKTKISFSLFQPFLIPERADKSQCNQRAFQQSFGQDSVNPVEGCISYPLGSGEGKEPDSHHPHFPRNTYSTCPQDGISSDQVTMRPELNYSVAINISQDPQPIGADATTLTERVIKPTWGHQNL